MKNNLSHKMNTTPEQPFVCLIEDDYAYAERLKHEFVSQFGDLKITHFRTESSVNSGLLALETNPPHLFILDGMIRAADPNEVAPEVEEQTLSGLRILKRIKDSSRLSKIPVIIHSALSAEEIGKLPQYTNFRSKKDDLAELIILSRSLLAQKLDIKLSKSHGNKPMGDAIKLSPEFMGFSIDLKRLWVALKDWWGKK